MKRWLPVIVALAILIVPGLILPRFGTDAVRASVAVRPEVMFTLGGVEISNTLLTSWIVVILLILLAFFSTRNMQTIPGGLQNVMETLIEALYGLCQSVASDRGKKFFPIVATIFLYVLVSNLLGLIPGFGPIGIIPVSEHKPAPQGIATFDLPPAIAESLGGKEGEEETAVLAPFFRSPSTDVNMPLALALISVIMTQVFGMQAVGPIRYWFARFLMFDKLTQFVGSLFRGKLRLGLLGFGVLDVFMGLLELVSEISKILSFTFRLFGNIFAGEVVLLIMAFLFFALPFPFYALETFVGFIQAFVFAILTLVFMTIATTAHGAEEHH